MCGKCLESELVMPWGKFIVSQVHSLTRITHSRKETSTNDDYGRDRRRKTGVFIKLDPLSDAVQIVKC